MYVADVFESGRKYMFDISISRRILIESLQVQRVEDFKGKDEVHRYRIRKPKGYGRRVIKHKYSDGHFVLLRKALDAMGV